MKIELICIYCDLMVVMIIMWNVFLFLTIELTTSVNLFVR